eukprot:3936222-Rhodomonas_salina.1
MNTELYQVELSTSALILHTNTVVANADENPVEKNAHVHDRVRRSASLTKLFASNGLIDPGRLIPVCGSAMIPREAPLRGTEPSDRAVSVSHVKGEVRRGSARGEAKEPESLDGEQHITRPSGLLPILPGLAFEHRRQPERAKSLVSPSVWLR